MKLHVTLIAFSIHCHDIMTLNDNLMHFPNILLRKSNLTLNRIKGRQKKKPEPARTNILKVVLNPVLNRTTQSPMKVKLVKNENSYQRQ